MQPTVWERRALSGLACAAAARGDREAARQLHARVLGPAMSHPPPPRSARAPSNPLAAFEHILGAAARVPAAGPEAAAVSETTPPDAEHWAHGEYGWFLFNEGNYEVCLFLPFQCEP